MREDAEVEAPPRARSRARPRRPSACGSSASPWPRTWRSRTASNDRSRNGRRRASPQTSRRPVAPPADGRGPARRVHGRDRRGCRAARRVPRVSARLRNRGRGRGHPRGAAEGAHCHGRAGRAADSPGPSPRRPWKNVGLADRMLIVGGYHPRGSTPSRRESVSRYGAGPLPVHCSPATRGLAPPLSRLASARHPPPSPFRDAPVALGSRWVTRSLATTRIDRILRSPT